ncbi:helix-turn-helix domain-containing protein [Kitasatospora sp. RB6PN24]|uniref:helix-turn-helix domain-containing protein n=1 Tax=Kitasatospora humi TaxID=2893891 RepID=UPI001E5BFBCE|nr:helix-turn-helix domain-containing protein [Kitasatospora humi]MCC9308397.1 helix-turn-helix domain-containing protein [Kitasatospora humi]
MHVHFIAPDRYVRASHDIIRHPRLRATAKTLLLWALSLPPGSRDTILTIGKRMPEGRTAVSRARAQLIEEGYLHVRRVQDPLEGTWSTRVLVSSVPLRDHQEVEAAWRSVGQNPALGERVSRDVGTSPLVLKSEEKTSPPIEATDPPDDERRAAAAKLLTRLTSTQRQLHLGVVEALELAPLVAEWLARDPDERRLRVALLSDLPPGIASPLGLLRSRLRRKMPAERETAECGTAVPAAPAVAMGECAQCADPVPEAGTICRRCAGVEAAVPAVLDPAAVERNRRGAALARSLLRGAVAA